jgi:trans-2,3-dihydro-3-hydroxyanthranilate isomerase
MPTYPFMQVDAFTTQRLAGNPCAIVFDADELTDGQMLAIAREMNLSETSFVLRSQMADVRARYFTPAEEIPMAGHPTVATFHALLETGRLAQPGNAATFSLELKAGVIRVDVAGSDANRHIIMTQKPPQFLSVHDPAVIMPIFGLTPDDAITNAPIQTVSTGTPQLMICVRDLDALRRIQMNQAAYSKLRQQSDFFSPHLFCVQGVTAEGQTFARHFGTPPDTMEDPFTGSATGGMAAYLWHHGLIDSPTFVAEQGHWMQRPGQATVEITGTRNNIEAVRVGGPAVTVLRGELVI